MLDAILQFVQGVGLPQWAAVAIAGAIAWAKRQDLVAWVKYFISGGKVPMPAIVPWDMDDVHDVLRRVLEEMIARLAGTDPRWQAVADKIAEALVLIVEIKRNPSPPNAERKDVSSLGKGT